MDTKPLLNRRRRGPSTRETVNTKDEDPTPDYGCEWLPFLRVNDGRFHNHWDGEDVRRSKKGLTIGRRSDDICCVKVGKNDSSTR